MELFEALLNRRSIRKYTGEEIENSKVDIILKSAMYAPTAMNYQPWEFIVIEDRKILKNIHKIITHADMLEEARLAILVCGNLEKEKSIDFNVQNCSAATQNILLAAHGLGLGGVWVGVHPNQENMNSLKKLLSLPEYVVPLTLAALGYPAEEKKAEERFFRSKIHLNKW